MRRKALLVEEREIQVINWFSIRIQHDNEDMATSYEIARGLGMSPSSHLRNILDGMVGKGSLVSEEIKKPGRFPGRGYMLRKGTFQRPPKQAIKITYGNANNRQMELL